MFCRRSWWQFHYKESAPPLSALNRVFGNRHSNSQLLLFLGRFIRPLYATIPIILYLHEHSGEHPMVSKALIKECKTSIVIHTL